MSINLLKMLQDQMGSSVVDQASKFLGESSSNTTSGINALLPSLLGGIMGKGGTESGASGVLDMITKGNHDGGIMDTIGNVFSGGSSTSNLMNAGSLLTSSLFGGSKLGSVLDIVTKVTGMRRSSSSSLMNLLAPMVMGMVGKQVKSGGLNASGLMNMLMGQKEHIASALPAGMGSILGFADTTSGSSVTEKVSAATTRTASAARETVKETANVTADVAKTGGSWLRWALPLVLLVGIGGFLFNKFGGGATDKVANMAGDAKSGMVEGAKNMGDAASKNLNAAGDAASSAAGTVTAAAGNMKDAAGNAVGNMKDAAGNAAGSVTTAAGGMKDAAGKAVGGMKDAAGNAAGGMKDAAGNATGKMKDAAGNVAGNMKAGADKVGSKIKGAANSAGGAVAGAGAAAGGALSAAGMKAKETFSGMFKSGASSTAYSLNNITFDPTGNKITNYDKDEVMALAAALKADPNAKIEVQAFSNAGKNAIKNKTIAMGRAKLIQQILTTLGVKASQLSTKGMAAKDEANANAIQVVVK